MEYADDGQSLLLSHPGPMVRDTQKCKALREVAKNKHPGLKKLCALEMGLEIQKGSHSSVSYPVSRFAITLTGRLGDRRKNCYGSVQVTQSGMGTAATTKHGSVEGEDRQREGRSSF